jgi:hypothetical protein
VLLSVQVAVAQTVIDAPEAAELQNTELEKQGLVKTMRP